MFAMFSSDFQAALKTHATDYEKLTVNEITDFYEQFEMSEARKKVSNECSLKSNNTSYSSGYKKRKINHTNYSQQSNKRAKRDNDDGENYKNGKSGVALVPRLDASQVWLCYITKISASSISVIITGKDIGTARISILKLL